MDLTAERVANHHTLGTLCEPPRILLGDVLMNQVTARRETYLALMKECSPGARAARAIQVRIRHDDQCVVAAQLERHALDLLAGKAPYSTTRPGRASKRDHSNPGVLDDGL